MDARAEGAVGRLRLARGTDAAAIAGIYAAWVARPGICFELEPPSPAVMAERIAAIGSAYPWIVAELDGQVRAYAYASRLRQRPAYDWAAETSIYVAAGHAGRGLGGPLYVALLDVLAEQGLRWAYGALVVDPAAAGPGPSQRFHARLGFAPVGRFAEVGYKRGRWWDIEWWRRGLAGPAASSDGPGPVRSLAEPALREWIAARLERG